MRILSKRQLQLLSIITTFTAANGYAPSLADMADQLKLSGTRAHQLALRLEAQGRLTHTPRVSRSWRVVDAQHQQAPTALQPASRRFRRPWVIVKGGGK